MKRRDAVDGSVEATDGVAAETLRAPGQRPEPVVRVLVRHRLPAAVTLALRVRRVLLLLRRRRRRIHVVAARNS